jgi:hypothetical protein
MVNLKRIADILVASWTLANGNESLPTGEGVLDRALKRAVDAGNFPDDLRNSLHFVPTSVGLRCAELRAILIWAQAAQQTSDPNPSYKITNLKASRNVALGLAHNSGIGEAEAQKWGRALTDAVESEIHALREFERT